MSDFYIGDPPSRRIDSYFLNKYGIHGFRIKCVGINKEGKKGYKMICSKEVEKLRDDEVFEYVEEITEIFDALAKGFNAFHLIMTQKEISNIQTIRNLPN